MIRENPSDLMDPPKKALALPRVLSEEEVAAMLDKVDGSDPRELSDRAILETLYGCGLRVSELCSLKMDDFVADGELLRIFGKGSKERIVPIGVAAGRALNAYFESARGFFAKGTHFCHFFVYLRYYLFRIAFIDHKFTLRSIVTILHSRRLGLYVFIFYPCDNSRIIFGRRLNFT